MFHYIEVHDTTLVKGISELFPERAKPAAVFSWFKRQLLEINLTEDELKEFKMWLNTHHW